jgi:multiple antibiotic resistance protein
VIIALIGLSMLRGEDHTHNLPQVAAEAKEKEALGVVPLAIPIFAGPGTISTIIAQSHQFPGLTGKLLVSLVCLICAIITLLVLLLSPLMARVLGASGMKVVTRVMGLILAAIAFQMLGEGMIGLLPGLAGIVGH